MLISLNNVYQFIDKYFKLFLLCYKCIHKYISPQKQENQKQNNPSLNCSTTRAK